VPAGIEGGTAREGGRQHQEGGGQAGRSRGEACQAQEEAQAGEASLCGAAADAERSQGPGGGPHRLGGDGAGSRSLVPREG